MFKKPLSSEKSAFVRKTLISPKAVVMQTTQAGSRGIDPLRARACDLTFTTRQHTNQPECTSSKIVKLEICLSSRSMGFSLSVFAEQQNYRTKEHQSPVLGFMREPHPHTVPLRQNNKTKESKLDRPVSKKTSQQSQLIFLPTTDSPNLAIAAPLRSRCCQIRI